MLSRLLPCCLFLFPFCNASAQKAPPLQEFQRHVLLGNLEAAREALQQDRASLKQAELALLEAALLGPPRRAKAMLDVCRLYPKQAVADTAMISGLAALLHCQGHSSLVPELEIEELDEDNLPDDFDPVGLAREYHRLLDQRLQSPERAKTIGQAQWMLSILEVRRIWTDPLRISTSAPIPVPCPLAEDLEVHFHPLELDEDIFEIYRRGSSEKIRHTQLKRASYGLQVPTPRPGSYVMELASKDEGWRSLQRLVVTDLQLVTQIWPEELIVMATCLGRPAVGAKLNLGTNSFTTGQDGVGRLELTPQLQAKLKGKVLRCQLGDDRCEITLVSSAPKATPSLQIDTHAIVDRPIYRPGEKVFGRVYACQHIPSAEGGFDSKPASGEETTVLFWPGTKHEHRILGQTDADGVLAFEFTIPKDIPLGQAKMQTRIGRRSWGRRPFVVEEYRRPPALFALHAPESVVSGSRCKVTVEASYPSGAVACGLQVDFQLNSGSLKKTRSISLDASGRGCLNLDLEGLPVTTGAEGILVEASLHAPDGQRITKKSRIRLRQPEPEKPRYSGWEIEFLPSHATAGEKIRIRLHGTPNTARLLTVAHTAPILVQRVELDGKGTAEIEFQTKASQYPALSVRADGFEGRRYPRTLWLAKPGLQIQMPGPKVSFQPGERAPVTLQVTDAAGRGIQATLAIAVVDERVYQHCRDRTVDPDDGLEPSPALPRAEVLRSLYLHSPWKTLGRQLVGGWILPPPVVLREGSIYRAGGRSAGGSPAPSGPAAGPRVPGLRKDFRATALFLPSARTDAAGRLRFVVPFPDETSTWRVTVVAIDSKVRRAMQRFQLRTEQPLTLTPILPRFLRQGDEAFVPVCIYQKIKAASPVRATLRAEGRQLEVKEREATAEKAFFHLRAREAGPAKLLCEGRAGEFADRSLHPLDVIPDLSYRPLSVTADVEGSQLLELPRESATVSDVFLTLLGNREALLAQAADYLGEYPHGCVEQTLSRLVPIFTAARARRLRGDGSSLQLTEAQALRLAAGMARLRQLLVDPNAGFAWWPGGEVDCGMSALAIHSLVQARDAGIDLESHGIGLRPRRGLMRNLAEQLLKADGKHKGPTGQLELAVACLLLDPHSKVHKQAVSALVTREQVLPAGLLVRAGLALLRARELPLAKTVLERLLEEKQLGVSAADRGLQFPGETTATVAAQTLELLLLLEPRHPSRTDLLTALFGQQQNGRFGSTWSTAAALTALTLDAAVTGAKPSTKPLELELQVEGRTSKVVLSRENGFRRRIALGRARQVRLKLPEEKRVLALLKGAVQVKGSAAEAWQKPIQVRRQLLPLASSGAASGASVDAALCAGRVYRLRLQLRATQALNYLVLDCPLPAGFEVISSSKRWEVRDDRVITTIKHLLPGIQKSVELQVVPGREGKFAWPPATAQAMYAPELCGASSGSRLVIGPAAATIAQSQAEIRPGPELEAKAKDLVARIIRTQGEVRSYLIWK